MTRKLDPTKKYRVKCPRCKRYYVSYVSGYEGEEHFHCPYCGAIKYA